MNEITEIARHLVLALAPEITLASLNSQILHPPAITPNLPPQQDLHPPNPTKMVRMSHMLKLPLAHPVTLSRTPSTFHLTKAKERQPPLILLLLRLSIQ